MDASFVNTSDDMSIKKTNNSKFSLQLDKAAPVLAGLKDPIIIAKVDADKYTRLASKYEIEYASAYSLPTLKN